MIPAYSEEVKIKIQEKDSGLLPLEQQVRQLQEQVRVLQESLEYANRDRSRMKSDIETIKNLLRSS